jgi:hypothetical protein
VKLDSGLKLRQHVQMGLWSPDPVCWHGLQRFLHLVLTVLLLCLLLMCCGPALPKYRSCVLLC